MQRSGQIYVCHVGRNIVHLTGAAGKLKQQFPGTLDRVSTLTMVVTMRMTGIIIIP